MPPVRRYGLWLLGSDVAPSRESPRHGPPHGRRIGRQMRMRLGVPGGNRVRLVRDVRGTCRRSILQWAKCLSSSCHDWTGLETAEKKGLPRSGWRECRKTCAGHRWRISRGRSSAMMVCPDIGPEMLHVVHREGIREFRVNLVAPIFVRVRVTTHPVLVGR